MERDNEKSKISIAFIVITVIICLCCDGLLIVYYNYKEQKLYSMETPMDIANEYMQPKYERHWRRLKGVFHAGKDSRKGQYMVARKVENIGRTYFSKVLGINSMLVYCETEIEDTWIEISSGYHSIFESIGVYVKVYNEDKGYWEGRDFMLEYDNGEYIVTEYNYMEEEEFPNKAGLEEVTGMTIEEIVEIAEKQQAACEDMLWEMKESELRRNKVRLFGGLVLINGTGIWLIFWKGLKRPEKNGDITGTETAPEDGMQYLKDKQE